MANTDPGMLANLLNVVWATGHIADVLATKANETESECLFCEGKRIESPGPYPDEFHFDHTDECPLVTLEAFKMMVEGLPDPDEEEADGS